MLDPNVQGMNRCGAAREAPPAYRHAYPQTLEKNYLGTAKLNHLSEELTWISMIELRKMHNSLIWATE